MVISVGILKPLFDSDDKNKNLESSYIIRNAIIPK